jgi:hypothetical protein
VQSEIFTVDNGIIKQDIVNALQRIIRPDYRVAAGDRISGPDVDRADNKRVM